MKIALLGGNAYNYGFAPSYVRANGRGVITQKQLLGDDGRLPTPAEAYETYKYYESLGLNPETEMNHDTLALAKQYKRERGWEFAERGVSLLEKGVGLVQGFTNKQTSTDDNAGRSQDNTALIIIGGVGLVAVIGVMLASKKKSGRRR